MSLNAKWSRRELMRALAAGGGVVAGELWTPGARLFSIPVRNALPDYPFTIEPLPVYQKGDLVQVIHDARREVFRVTACCEPIDPERARTIVDSIAAHLRREADRMLERIAHGLPV